MPFPAIGKAIQEGFGVTLGYIGIVILLGTIIGAFLEKSGGAFALAEKILAAIGLQSVHFALSLIGFLVSIPVFCDSGFVILAPLMRALSKKAGVSTAGTGIALALGLLSAHTMIPPTPGPVAAAGIFGADLGYVLIISLPVGFSAMLAGWFFAFKVAARFPAENTTRLEAVTDALPGKAPGTLKTMLPIALPIVLIIGKSVATVPGFPLSESLVLDLVLLLGEPMMALLVGVFVAFTLPKPFTLSMWSQSGWVGQAMIDAAIIIMITGAGGAFGKILQVSGMVSELGKDLPLTQLGIFLPFLLAALLKTAQGSSTVAIITTASILAPLLPGLGVETPLHAACMVVATGAGALVVSHANDSFFWVVTQMSGLQVKAGYQLHTMGSLILGCTAMLVLSLIFWIAVL
jgi:GntP family gluconate:H+ symporter